MRDALSAGLLLALLCGSALAGRGLTRILPENHRSRDTMDFVRVASSLLVTFTALVLSLLLSTVSGDFKKTDTDLRTYASMMILLDQELGSIGPSARPAQTLLRRYTASAIASTWPEEPAPSGTYPGLADLGEGVDAPVLGDMLHRVEAEIRALVPGDPAAEKAQAACLARVSALLDQRWNLIAEAHPTLAPAFVTMMVAWLVIVFVSFGLTAPHNPTASACIGLVALSVAGAAFITLELDGPLDGLVKVGSAPLRQALAHIDRSSPPEGPAPAAP